MFEQATTFGGISVDDLDAARAFYGETLGLRIHEGMGGINVELPGDAHLWVYPKSDHRPAAFTVLNFSVPDIDAAVDALTAAGVTMTVYEGFWQDERGVARGRSVGRGPDIAWFADPAGNILAVLQEGD
ncbi:VOC family protein [Amnibacterium sp.]|uniref:VOC family protein n=1 Tax=Amnibacterium sp. TaxID=1872496 RepID=UPI00262E8B25|nr:VOC family protein [Amnibacterium sp.]MCU1472925.1 glyoxalase [Amnibacterium sp.]